ncbi:MAG: DUF3857 domain-containing protein [Sphingomicrobium sp.]
MRLIALVGCIGFNATLAANALAAPTGAVAPPAHDTEGSKVQRPSVGKVASWVLEAPIPPAPEAARGTATVTLLADSQINLLPDAERRYFHSAYQIGTAQGLEDGSIALSWDPSVETLEIHHIRRIRKGEVVDLLRDGSALSVIQRERNLEQASLDGELTAMLQPDDLRVGDVISYAFTRTRSDPVLRGNAELLLGPPDGATLGRSRIRVLWDQSRNVTWRAMPGVVQPKIRQMDGKSELLSDLFNVTTKEPPRGAPSRFRVVNSVMLSDFGSWAAVASKIEPFYARASELNPTGPLKAEARRIAASTSDPVARAEQALALVQEQVRYLFLAMDGGGYLPASADVTWARRYGDCKAKTVLLLALLRELGVKARGVLVQTEGGDFTRERLPALGAFDHVIVEAMIGGRSYWLDGTRLGDRRLSQLSTPNYYAGLPIVPENGQLVAMAAEPPTKPDETIILELDATEGLDVAAPAKAEMRLSRETARNKRLEFADLSPTERDRTLREMWRKLYDFIAPASVQMTDEPASGDLILTMIGKAKMDWSDQAGTRWYEVDGSGLGWKFDTDREGQLNAEAPFAFDYPDWWTRVSKIKLPRGGEGFALQGGTVDERVGDLYAFRRSAKIEAGVLTMEASSKALAAELPASKSETVRTRLAALASDPVFVRVPADYIATDGDIAALKSDRPAQAKALMLRGAHRFDKGLAVDSLADINAALALDSSLGAAHAIRSMLLAQSGDAAAETAADRALSLDPKLWLAWSARGVLALKTEKFADAEKAFTSSIQLEPKFARTFAGRGAARFALGKAEDALADFDTALGLDATLPLRGARAATLAQLNRNDEALAELNRALEQKPNDSKSRKMRASLNAQLGQLDQALSDYNVLIKEKPSVALYLGRASIRSSVEAKSDIEAALRLDPQSSAALIARSKSSIDGGDFKQATRDLATLEKKEPDNRVIPVLRRQLFLKQGRREEALSLADADINKYGDATAYNERCWFKATANMALDTALADCNKALQLAPNTPAMLDSRAFVKLRMGETDAAIADYDAALKLAPKLAASLLGRAIARARRGERATALVDLASARKVAPDIEARFAEFGVVVPANLTAN